MSAVASDGQTTALAELRSEVERCGGTLTCDEQGRPIDVDLLIGRASADVAVLDALKACPDVKILRARVGQLTADQLTTIGFLTDLQELMLLDATIDDNTLVNVIGNLPQLRRLTLRNAPKVTDRAISKLANHSALTHLALIDMQITGKSLTPIASMPILVLLDLRMCHGVRGDDLAVLASAPELRELKLGGSGIDNAALAVVAELPHLQSLMIEDSVIDGAGLSSLAELNTAAKRLDTLSLARCTALSDDQLHSLTALRNLRELTLRDVPITGSFLRQLQFTDQLELLSLNQTFLVEGAYERVADFRNLTRLELAQNILTLRSMEYISTLTKLEYLNLTDCALTDDLLEPLASLPHLKTLIVSGNPDVSREAVSQLLGHENP